MSIQKTCVGETFSRDFVCIARANIFKISMKPNENLGRDELMRALTFV